VARLPLHEVVSATHYVTDLTLGLGEVVFDYLKDAMKTESKNAVDLGKIVIPGRPTGRARKP
jgi:hypothetical protein